MSAPADPTKVGYTFAGWDLVPETMPAAATTVTAQWANATQASYQVVYWGENLTGGYDYLYADKATGAVGSNIPYSTSLTDSRMPQGLEAAGFELDSVKSAGNVEITADGSAGYCDHNMPEMYLQNHPYKEWPPPVFLLQNSEESCRGIPAHR